MGYSSYVRGEVTVKPESLDRIRADIAEARKRDGNGDWHIYDTEINTDDPEQPTLTPYEDDAKWYDFQKFLDWINKYAFNGEVIRSGEEDMDIEGYQWREGQMYRLEIIEKWVKVEQ
ncbi:MAG: hypothetical protein ACTSWQ_06690 [Candidatus Thorarchaeota archaeon]